MIALCDVENSKKNSQRTEADLSSLGVRAQKVGASGSRSRTSWSHFDPRSGLRVRGESAALPSSSLLNECRLYAHLSIAAAAQSRPEIDLPVEAPLPYCDGCLMQTVGGDVRHSGAFPTELPACQPH